MKIDHGNFQVVRACCTSGNCVQCFARFDKTKRRVVVQLHNLSEKSAGRVAESFRDYDAAVVPNDWPVPEFIGRGFNAPPPSWSMVTCATCGLLVGWTREPLSGPFYCIPHFDSVAHLPDGAEISTRRKAGS